MPNGDIGDGNVSKRLPKINRRRFMTGPKNYRYHNNNNNNHNIRTVSPWRPPPDHHDSEKDNEDRRTSSLPNITPPLHGGPVDAEDGT